MNIIHYTLGVPPYRSGGLTKYSTDLAIHQQKDGHNITILSAGGVNILSKDIYVSHIKDWNNIKHFEIINSVPIPLLYGISSNYTKNANTLKIENIQSFIKLVKPDIFHIHTLMGLPIELVNFLKSENIKIIYTTHDYFGLCLKVNFIDNDQKICTAPSPSKCALCNIKAPSNLFLRIRSSKIIYYIKDILKMIPSTRKVEKEKKEVNLKEINNYKNILLTYRNILNSVDIFHFNSNVAKEEYEKLIEIKQFEVIPITHGNIQDKRILKSTEENYMKISFIGSLEYYKGFDMLKNSLLNYNNWILNAWGNNLIGNDLDNNNIKYNGKYSREDLENIFANTDLLVVPSICKETFSLVTLEALSFGVPVLVSTNVGAKDIVAQYNSEFIFNTESDLKNILSKIFDNPTILQDYNKRILSLPWNHNLDKHLDDILRLYNTELK